MVKQTVTGRQRRYLVAGAYVTISAVASLAFFLAARAKGATTTDLYLGLVWVFALSAIVSASLLPPLFERWQRRTTTAGS